MTWPIVRPVPVSPAVRVKVTAAPDRVPDEGEFPEDRFHRADVLSTHMLMQKAAEQEANRKVRPWLREAALPPSPPPPTPPHPTPPPPTPNPSPKRLVGTQALEHVNTRQDARPARPRPLIGWHALPVVGRPVGCTCPGKCVTRAHKKRPWTVASQAREEREREKAAMAAQGMKPPQPALPGMCGVYVRCHCTPRKCAGRARVPPFAPPSSTPTQLVRMWRKSMRRHWWRRGLPPPSWLPRPWLTLCPLLETWTPTPPWPQRSPCSC
jgi:hypothetical protein